MKNPSLFHKIINSTLAGILFVSTVIFPTTSLRAQYVSTLPKPGEMVLLSPKFDPTVLQGLTIHPENPLLFDFLVDRGDDNLPEPDFKNETQKLIKYFLAAMTIPENESWVNLSPYEGDRIIPDLLASTEMGKQMLEQDYLLKQLSSSLTNPEKELGKKFWDTVYKRAFELYGKSEIPVSTFNKVWIMPQKAVIVEKDGYAFISFSRLKVMMDEDRSLDGQRSVEIDAGAPSTAEAMASRGALKPPSDVAQRSSVALDAGRSTLEKKSATNVQPPTSSLSSKIFRETILPQIEKEVNEGKNFAPVRQIYNSVILAAWYKQNLKETLLGKIYVDKGKIKGVDIPEKDVKQKVYAQYLDAFRRGAYNLIEENYDLASQETLPRKYFSGGVTFASSNIIERLKTPIDLKNLDPDFLELLKSLPDDRSPENIRRKVEYITATLKLKGYDPNTIETLLKQLQQPLAIVRMQAAESLRETKIINDNTRQPQSSNSNPLFFYTPGPGMTIISANSRTISIPGKINNPDFPALVRDNDFLQWLQRQAKIAEEHLPKREDQGLYMGVITAAIISDTRFGDAQTTQQLDLLVSLMHKIDKTAADNFEKSMLAAKNPQEKRTILNTAISDIFFRHPKYLPYAAKIFGIDSRTPMSLTSKQTESGRISIFYAPSPEPNIPNISMIIILKKDGQRGIFSASENAGPLLSLFESAQRLETFLSDTKKTNVPGSMSTLPDGNIALNTDYILALGRAEQIQNNDFTGAFTPAIAHFIRNNTLGSSQWVIDMNKEQNPQARRTIFLNNLKTLLTDPQTRSSFLLLFPVSHSHDVIEINQGGGKVTIIYDPLTEQTTFKTSGISFSPDLTSNFTGDLRSIANLFNNQFMTASDIAQLLLNVGKKKSLDSEEQGYALQILATLQSLPDGEFDIQDSRGQLSPQIKNILEVFEKTDQLNNLVRSLKQIAMLESGIKKEMFINFVFESLNKSNLDAVANILKIKLQRKAALKNISDGGDIVIAYDSNNNKSTLTFHYGNIVILNGDWRKTTLFDNLPDTLKIEAYLKTAARNTSLTPDQQAQYFQILASRRLSKGIFERDSRGKFKPEAEILLEDISQISDNEVQRTFKTLLLKGTPKQARIDILYNLIVPAVLKAQGNEKFIEDLQKMHKIRLQPLLPTAASSTIVHEFMDGTLTIENFPFTDLASITAAANPFNDFKSRGGLFRQTDLQTIEPLISALSQSDLQANHFSRLIEIATENALGVDEHGAILRILLTIYTMPEIEFGTSYSSRVKGILDILGENIHGSKLTSETETKEAFLKTVEDRLSANLYKLDDIERLLEINTLTVDKSGGKIFIFYSKRNDQSNIIVQTTELDGRQKSSKSYTVKGDWRSNDYAFFKSAAGFNNALGIVDTAKNLNSKEQYALLQIFNKTTIILSDEFKSGEYSPRVKSILALVDYRTPEALRLSEVINKFNTDTRARRQLFSELVPTLLIENPKTLPKIAAALDVPIASASVAETSRSSSTVKKSVGGIDFNPSFLDLQIKRDGKGVPLILPMQNIDSIHIEGLYPIIINIAPARIENLPFLTKTNKNPLAS